MFNFQAATLFFHNSKKSETCSRVLKYLFVEQKPTITLFGGDGAQYFAKKTSRDYEKENNL